MRKAWMPLMAALGVALVAAGVLADTAAVRKELVKDYAAMDRALVNKDLKGVFAKTTADFTMVERGGTRLTRKQTEKTMAQEMKMLASGTTMKTTIVKLTVKGKQAVAVTRGKLTTTAMGTDRRKHTMTAVSTTRDTWVAKKAGWRLKSAVELNTTMTTDSKPFRAPTGLPKSHRRR